MATNAKGKHSPPGQGNVYAKANDGMFAAMHKLTQEQIMDAELTREIAFEHDTVMVEQVMVEQAWDGRGKGTILG